MRIDLRLDVQDVLDRLAGIDQFASAPRAALVDVAALRVQQQGSWIRSAPYKPLKPRSARRKALKGRPTRPLVGGALERSLTTQRAAGSIRRLNKMSVVVGTRDPTAHLHQSGARGGKLPVRRVINVTAADRDAMREVFASHVAAATAGNPRVRRFAA